jgi:hypothetical protein
MRGLTMANSENESADKGESLKARIRDATIAMGGAGVVIFGVVIAAQIIVAALGVTLDHQCRIRGGKEHCVIAAAMAPAQAIAPGVSQSPRR